MPHETHWLDKEEAKAWRSLLRAQAATAGKLDRELATEHKLGLPDYEVLSQLSVTPGGSLRMTELAHNVLLSPSGLTRRLDGLVRSGFVERQPCPSDGRGLLAVLTDAGREKAGQMAPTHATGVRRHFVNCMTRDQLQEVIAIFEPLVEHQEGDETSDSNGTVDTRTPAGVS